MKDDKNNFEDGWLDYQVFSIAGPEELPQEIGWRLPWDDGCIAFSRGEVPLADIADLGAPNLWNERAKGIEGVEGYLMEFDLWRHDAKGIFEEISIEREDGGFICQHWWLDTGETKETNCYYRQAKTLARRPIRHPIGREALFDGAGLLLSLECIMPDHRLHFFITTGRSK